MKVNMTPNPLDVVTIHASQGDTEARQWEFELHNNGELIDTSDITEQLFFKAYKGGTEQILPENTSTPTTSPFIGDIRYPQGLLTDQEFTYRQSPTEEDGLAKITDIKGNTLKWNQLAKVKESFTSLTSNGITLSRVDDHLHIQGTATSTAVFNSNVNCNEAVNFPPAHKFLLSINPKNVNVMFGVQGYGVPYFAPAIAVIRPSSETTDWKGVFQFRVDSGVTVNADLYLQAFDLTAMGLADKTNADIFQWFADYFPLSYYAYNQGSLLSFNGNGIKTVGKNLLSYSGENLPYNASGVSITRENNIYKVVASNPSGYPFARISTIHYLPKGQYTFTMLGAESSNAGIAGRLINRNVSPAKILVDVLATNTVVTLKEDVHDVYFELTINASKLSAGTWDVRFQLNMGTPSDYEPYTSSTLSLPISTYFTTGMKSAGSVYDELTESKAITRIGSVDLGSLNWTYQSSSGNMYVDNVVSNRKNNLGFNAICSKYQQVNEDTISGVASLIQDKSFAFQYSFNGRIIVRDTSYTDATVFKQAMADQNVKLYYELATPTETSFTTASLVTENAEIPLSNEDGVLIGKCTEQLSENPGFIDAKIKLSDADGECYSNKLQLHVERSPQ